MRAAALIATLYLTCASASLADTSVASVWDYLTKEEYASQWAVVSIAGNKGYVQCERYEQYLRCPFPVWAKLLPSAKLFAPVSAQAAPYPDLEGTVTKTYMSESQAEKLVRLLVEEELEYAEVYSQLEDQNAEPAGTNHDVILVLELDYADFEALVENVLTTVWDADPEGGYQIETDQY